MYVFFFFQAEDGIRDLTVTGVQTCALPICVNAGSLEREFAMKYGFPCPPAMVDSALRYIEIAESEGYHEMIVSLKSSDVMTVVEAYRLYAKQADYPTHIGVTEAGKPPYAVPNSACGLAPILLDGIGDT